MGLDLSRFPGRNIVWLESCPTTMTEAARLAAQGAPHGTVVGAGEQTAGQGRMDRRWHSERGAGLYVSVILRVADASVLTLALGLATAEAIRAVTGLDCDLRWPNDVLLGRRKCAGILVHAERGAHIAGIGINVNHARFPDEIARTATSLRIAAGETYELEPLLATLLAAIDRWTAASRETVIARFSELSSYARGKRVVVDGKIRGITDGLDEAGFLWVRDDRGQRVQVVAGGVREV